MDEWDCFRRARFLHLSDAAERSLGEETGGTSGGTHWAIDPAPKLFSFFGKNLLEKNIKKHDHFSSWKSSPNLDSESPGQHRLTPKPIPLDFMREWLDGSMPMTTIVT